MPKHSYRAVTGLPYQQPHGCFYQVARVFDQVYGVDLWSIADELGDDALTLRRVYACLMRHCVEVDDPREGDVVLIRAEPWHVGVVVEPGRMIHSYSGDGDGSSVIEPYDGPDFDVRGFFRYVG